MNRKKHSNAKSFLSYICYSAIFLLFAIVATCILYNANWIFGDDWQIMATTAVNKFGLHGHYGGGRFWPLGLCDYNLLIFIKGGNTPLGHYLYNTFILAIFLITIFYLIKEIVKDNQQSLYLFTFFFLILLITKDFIRIHIDVIYPERTMVFVLSVFLLFYLKGLNTDKTLYYLIAFLSACYLTYCKEPMFGALLVISSTNLLLKYKKMSDKELYFYVALIVNSIVYFSLWYFFAFKTETKFYNLIFSSYLSVVELIKKIINDKPIFILITVIGVTHLYYIIIKKDYERLFYDSLLFAGIAYAGAFIYLNLIHSYYFLIALLFTFPSFIYWINYGFKCEKKIFSFIFMCAVFVLSIYNINLTIKFIECIHTFREEDKKLIKTLESLQQSGKKIVFFDTPDKKAWWYYNICNSFFKYQIKKDIDILIVTSLEEISPNDVVIYPPFETLRLKKMIEKIDFEKIYFHPIINTRVGIVYVK